jgi:hypothetical protein
VVCESRRLDIARLLTPTGNLGWHAVRTDHEFPLATGKA